MRTSEQRLEAGPGGQWGHTFVTSALGRGKRACLPALIALLSLALAGCPAEAPECGPGTISEDGLCVPVCAQGTELDEESGECVAICVPGTHRNEETGGCLPDSALCTSGLIWDAGTEECIEVAAICASGTTWVAGERRCVHDDDLLQADLVEGEDENDPVWGGPEAYEYLEMPAEGETITLSGSIDSPRDRNGDGVVDPDLDYWVFQIDEPTLLRVGADGLGGATSGFHVISIDMPQYHRYGVGTTSTDTLRDLFLPRAGAYALVATDGLNLVTQGMGPYHGGGEMGYFISLTPLPIPEPQELSMQDGLAEGTGDFPLAPPEDGTMLGFYSIELTGGSAYDFQISSFSPGPVYEELLVLPELASSVWSRKIIKGLVEDQRVLLVADYAYFFGGEPGEHRVSVSQIETTWVDQQLPPTEIEQDAWGEGGAMPAQWLGFEAGDEEVVTVQYSSSTGRTCLQVWDEHFINVLDDQGCVVGEDEPALHEGALRFLSLQGGFFGLTSLDWDQVDFSDFRYSVPQHTYELGLRVLRQQPLQAGTFSGSWSGSLDVGDHAPERFGTIVVPAGRTMSGSLDGEGDPWLRFYEAGAGQLRPAAPTLPGGGLWRSVETELLLFGVGNTEGIEASHGLELTELTIPTVATVPATGTLDESFDLEAGKDRWLMRLGHEAPGLALLELTANGEEGLLVRALDGNLTPRSEQMPLGALASALHVPMSDDGIFLEVATASGAPLAAAAQIGISAELEAAKSEGARNFHYVYSQLLTTPSTVTASLSDAADVDWYRMDVEEPATITIQTLPRGTDPAMATMVLLADRSGETITWNVAGGVGRHGLVSHRLEEPGTYTFAVVSAWGETGDYLLSAILSD